MLTIVIATIASAFAADAAVRSRLFLAARRAARPRPAGDLEPLIVVPARAEGARVAATLASARGAKVLLLLDGADAAAEAAAHEYGAKVVVKEPAGPTKAAALAWLAREHRALIEQHGAVMLLDVGSQLAPSFLEQFAWPDDADAVQTYLDGGRGGAADSERHAQSYEDRGREALGWNVRLRGTGSGFTSNVFLALSPRLVTRIEDLEASLLLHRARIRMAPPGALVIDQKPDSIHDSASQRARWLVGRYELLIRGFPELVKYVIHRPAEGAAFLAEIFGRPLSLTLPLRGLAAAWLVWRGWYGTGAAIAASMFLDVLLFAGRMSPRAAMRLATSWVLAAAMTPRALVRWTKVRRK